MKTTGLLLGIVASAALSGSGLAAPCVTAPYSDYLASGFSCTVSDKTFSDFSFSSKAMGAGTALMATDLTAGPNITSDGPGLIFSSTAISVTTTPIGSDSFIDVGVGFAVTAGPGFLIDDAALDVTGATSGSGSGSVNETISTLALVQDPPMSVEFDGDQPPPVADATTFPPVPGVEVSKNILVQVPANTTGSASIDTVAQQFSQIPIAEPDSLALFSMTLGTLGLVILYRKSNRC